MKKQIVLLGILLTSLFSFAQKNVELKEEVEGNDTLLIASTLKPVDVISKRKFNSWEEEAAFIKL